MNKKGSILILLILLSIVKGFTQPPTRMDSIKSDPYTYPWLWNMFETYFLFHYELPKTPEELICFTNRIDMFMYSPGIDYEVKSITIPKIEKYIKEINFSVKDSVFYVQIKDSIYKQTDFLNEPCNYIENYEANPYQPGYPFLKDVVSYFDTNNQPLVNDSLIESLDAKFKDIKYLVPEIGIDESFNFFTFSLNKNEYPYRLFLEYTLDKELRDFCTKKEMPVNSYHNEIKRLAGAFCLENNLKRIIWFGFKHN